MFLAKHNTSLLRLLLANYYCSQETSYFACAHSFINMQCGPNLYCNNILSVVLTTTIVLAAYSVFSTCMKQYIVQISASLLSQPSWDLKPHCSIIRGSVLTTTEAEAVYILNLWHWLSCWSTFNGAEFE